MSIPPSGPNSRSKHLYSSRHKLVILRETLAYLETDSEIAPPEADAEFTETTREPCPAGIFMRQIY